MTTLPIRNSTSWSSQPPFTRTGGYPAVLPRPHSALPFSTLTTTRPLSVCSTLSAVSAASSASSLTGDRRRRSVALLDLETELALEEQTGNKPGSAAGIRSSLIRAEEVLRASERERELERRRDRAGFRTRQVRSAHLLNDSWRTQHVEGEEDDATEDLSIPVPALPLRQLSPAPLASAQEGRAPPASRRNSIKRFSPKRLLKKARSIPTDLLLSPANGTKRWSNESSASENAPSPPAAVPAPQTRQTSKGESASPRRPLRPPPRRARSAADLLSSSPTVVPSAAFPRPPASFFHPPSYYGTLPSRLDRIHLPENNLPSKFSASSGDSIGYLVQLASGGTAKNGKGFKDRARTISHAGASGLKSLKGRMRAPSSSNLREKSVGPTGAKGAKRKPSLANLFSGMTRGARGGSSADASAESSVEHGASAPPQKRKGRTISFAASSILHNSSAPSSSASGHRPSTSSSSYAPSTATSDSHGSHPSLQDRQQPSRKPSRLGFFRSALRDSSISGGSGSLRSRSRTRSSGGISPSIISRPLSVATSSASGGAADPRRLSEVSSSPSMVASVPSSSELSDKKAGGWASKISWAVKGKGKERAGGEGNVAAKRALFERKDSADAPTLMEADKPQVQEGRSPEGVARLAFRIPLATVFPRAQSGPPVRPPRPQDNLHSSDDTTFHGHHIPGVKTRAAAIDASATQELTSSAPRIRAKTSIPVAKARLHAMAPSVSAAPLPTYRPTLHKQHAATFGCSTVPPAASSTLLPPAPIYPAYSLPSRRLSPDSSDEPSSPSDTGSGGFSSDSSPYQRALSPFRSPSPARFRDLLPSATAQSSPERNENGLPVPLEQSPRSSREGDSPKKQAMGPEQVIVMENVREPVGPVADVRLATADLGAFLFDFEDTADFETSAVPAGSVRSLASTSTTSSAFVAPSALPHIQADVSDLSASLRRHLPHLDSTDSLRSTVSDVPQDLKALIDEVDDHISLHEGDLVPSLSFEGQSMGARGFADELEELQVSNDFATCEASSGDDDEEPERRDGTSSTAFTMGAFLSLPPGAGEHTTRVLDEGGATATFGIDATTGSFEGVWSTAGAVLRSAFSGDHAGSVADVPTPFLPPVLRDVPEIEGDNVESTDSSDDDMADDPRAALRESVREALEMGRPSNGDRMFERVDDQVQLAALLGSPSPPASPEQVRQTAFLRNHFRNGSLVSSTEGSLDSHFTINNSPTPYPRCGRPLRQSLARYSQDYFPTKRPSHRARPISEQSSSSSAAAEHQRLDLSEATNISLAQSTRSTNLSISSITSSPCPVPKSRRIPMLTGNRPPPLQPSFRFPPEKSSSATLKLQDRSPGFGSNLLKQFAKKRTGEDTTEEYTGPIASATLQAATSPRFVRPLQPSQPGEPLPRPRLLKLQQLEERTVPPDTPPPSSPSVSDGERQSLFSLESRQPSFDDERGPAPPVSRRNRHQGRHSRQTSRSSSILQSVIAEEPECSVSLNGTTVELAVRLHLQPLSPIKEPPSPLTFPTSPYSELPSVEIVLSSGDECVQPRLVELDDESDSDEDFELTAETNFETTRVFLHFNYEADSELKRSWSLWPDTEASREAVALFNAPRTYHAILEFLFYSQTRFPSPPHLMPFDSFISPAFADPPTPPSPIRIPSPIVDSSFENTGLLATIPPSPSPQPTMPPPPLTTKAKAAHPARRPFGEKPVNKQVSALSRSTSSPSKQPKEDHSPFTALPPRVGSKLRGVRAKLASKSPKKTVDTSFLGAKVSTRRQGQLDAAMRRLEGTGKPSEQRSDSESDFTGVLEAAGEATDEFTFTKYGGFT
ncbi:hypothetical protein JCM11641_007006 [Rhodosporidiobolus odoratus]